MSPAEARRLLRRFEPILRFTHGERFYPMDTAPWVKSASLWEHIPGQLPERLLAPGECDLERLAGSRARKQGHSLFLQVAEPLAPHQMALEVAREIAPGSKEERFHEGRGRLARVGLLSRMLDAFFNITLLFRGRVPGDAAHASAHWFRQEERGCRYHARVVEEEGWTVLQYWFFYAYNDWRSRFNGLNDHEGDWEMVTLYCSGEPSELQPEWVAFASHDFSGDDLRRRWDDPALNKEGEHVVVYPAAGSHASYFEAGEYITEIELPPLRPLAALRARVLDLWYDTLRQYGGHTRRRRDEGNPFKVAFIDYARGDGRSVGAGQAIAWEEPRLLDEAWVEGYRGLWGLDTQDPFRGEDGPGGPRYERDGSVRRAWYDPLAWAGLDKLPAPQRLRNELEARREEIREKVEELSETIASHRREVRGIGLELQALTKAGSATAQWNERRNRQESLLRDLTAASEEQCRLQERLAALEDHSDDVEDPRHQAAQSHLRRAHHPLGGSQLRRGRIAETWAAASVGLLLLGMVAVLIFYPQARVLGAVVLFTAFMLVEATTRGRLGALLTAFSLFLATISILFLLVHYAIPVLIGAALFVGAWMLFENLRELWG